MQRKSSAFDLTAVGLSATGILSSTGSERHVERQKQGEIGPDTLARYGADLVALSESARAAGAPIPVDFWDVRTPAMAAVGHDEYSLASMLNRPSYRPYVTLLARSFRHLCAFKIENEGTAVAAALSILCEAAAYTDAGHATHLTGSLSGLQPREQAIVLWQQLLTGTNREMPFLNRDIYTHGLWGRFNVVETWRYHGGENVPVDAVWGLSGFAPSFIRDPTNTNQIEHMAISALAQTALGMPVLLLNALEEAEWMLGRGSCPASRADKRLNSAVARELLPHFRLDDPAEACARLELALSER